MNLTESLPLTRHVMFMASIQSTSTLNPPPKVANIERIEIRPTKQDPKFLDNLREASAKTGQDMAVFARVAINEAAKRVKNDLPAIGEINWAMLGTNQFRAPLLARVPCGPWDKALATDQTFVINRDVADELEAQADDVFVRAEGASMEGAGIQDDFLVLARPYKNRAPKRGDIVLIQVFTGSENDEGVAEEAALGTIKRFNGMSGNVPKLLDGNDEVYELPENTLKTDIIARAIGVIGRL